MTFGKNLSNYFTLSSVLILGACSYAVESSHQKITFLTPDAQDAKCDVYINKLKYNVHPPETLDIKKSPKDMEIVCYAPGNRVVELSVPAEFSSRALWGGPAGVAWDYASQSLHYYPSVIAIDFSQEDLKPNKFPQHNNSDIRQPETYDLEEFKPSHPRMNSDKNEIEQPILQRGEEYTGERVSEDLQVMDNTYMEDEKDNFDSVLKGLTETSNMDESSDVLAEPTEEPEINASAPQMMNEGEKVDSSDKDIGSQEAISEPVQIFPDIN